jgi:hypothetical protein
VTHAIDGCRAGEHEASRGHHLSHCHPELQPRTTLIPALSWHRDRATRQSPRQGRRGRSRSAFAFDDHRGQVVTKPVLTVAAHGVEERCKDLTGQLLPVSPNEAHRALQPKLGATR